MRSKPYTTDNPPMGDVDFINEVMSIDAAYQDGWKSANRAMSDIAALIADYESGTDV